MAISKKKRFEIFKRDNFQCQYCGKSVPEAVLEVDHVIPKSEGGEDKEENLLTSCFSCNRGKGTMFLDKKKYSENIKEQMEMEKKQAEQEKIYKNFLMEKKRVVEEKVELVDKHLHKLCEDKWHFEKSGKRTIKMFLRFLIVEEITDALDITRSKFPVDSKHFFRYWCGVCWQKIKNKQG